MTSEKFDDPQLAFFALKMLLGLSEADQLEIARSVEAIASVLTEESRNVQ